MYSPIFARDFHKTTPPKAITAVCPSLVPLTSRGPVRTDEEGRLPCHADPVAGLSTSVLDDEDRLSTTGCCFVRSRDAARLTPAPPGVAVGGATAMYVSSVVSSDAISTARLLGDSAAQRTCSLTTRTTRDVRSHSKGPPRTSKILRDYQGRAV